jgi:hypothetical protein
MVSPRALKSTGNPSGSFNQPGKKPQRIKRKCRLMPSWVTTAIGSVGEILPRGGKLGVSS